MDQLYLKETFVIYLNKDFKENENICEISTIFPKSIQIDRLMECGICDMILPVNLYSIENALVAPENLKLSLNLKLYPYSSLDRANIDNFVLQLPYSGEYRRPELYSDTDTKMKEYLIELDENFKDEDLLKQIKTIVNTKIIKDIGPLFDSYNYEPKAFDEKGEAKEDLITIDELKLVFSDNKIFFQPGYIKFKYKKYIEEKVIDEFKVIANQEFSEEDLDPEDPNSFENLVSEKIADIRSGVNKAIFWITFSEGLHNLLGLSRENYPFTYLDKYDVESPSFEKIQLIYLPNYDYNIVRKTKETKTSIDVVYIYSDIVRETYVGSQKANLLKVIPFIKEKSYYMFSNINFVPLRVENIDSIKISMRNHLGKELFFDEGMISLSILIRPIEHL